ncbi:MAG TPA: YraN family protein [Kofleriaceae bacterium]|nr:YraN family protein [Kofleriaceae bacterium]
MKSNESTPWSRAVERARGNADDMKPPASNAHLERDNPSMRQLVSKAHADRAPDNPSMRQPVSKAHADRARGNAADMRPPVSNAHLERDKPSVKRPVLPAQRDCEQSSVQPPVSKAQCDRDKPSVKPPVSKAQCDRDKPSVKPPLSKAQRDRDKPSLKPPVSKEQLERDRQVLMFDDAAGPPTTIHRGNASEAHAAAYLERVGMRIIERNFKTRLGELDIIARDGATLVFIEVRSRSTTTFGSAVEAVHHHKQRKVTRIAWQYIKVRRPRFDTARFDVVGITAGELVHIRDAWRIA